MGIICCSDYLHLAVGRKLSTGLWLAQAYYCHQVDTTSSSVLPHSVIRAVRSAYFDIRLVAPMILAATRRAKRMWGGCVWLFVWMQTCRQGGSQRSPGDGRALANTQCSCHLLRKFVLADVKKGILHAIEDKKPKTDGTVGHLQKLARSWFTQRDKSWRRVVVRVVCIAVLEIMHVCITLDAPANLSVRHSHESLHTYLPCIS
jgi:hypothetical protein